MANTSCIIVLTDHSRWPVWAGTDIVFTPDGKKLVWISAETTKPNAIETSKIARILT